MSHAPSTPRSGRYRRRTVKVRRNVSVRLTVPSASIAPTTPNKPVKLLPPVTYRQRVEWAALSLAEAIAHIESDDERGSVSGLAKAIRNLAFALALRAEQ